MPSKIPGYFDLVSESCVQGLLHTESPYNLHASEYTDRQVDYQHRDNESHHTVKHPSVLPDLTVVKHAVVEEEQRHANRARGNGPKDLGSEEEFDGRFDKWDRVIPEVYIPGISNVSKYHASSNANGGYLSKRFSTWR
jgi:hypothetical protein